MIKAMNVLPVAVHHESGGNARTRVGGQIISLNGATSGSFQVTAASKYRAYLNSRSTVGASLLIGYQNPLEIHSAEAIVQDMNQLCDDVPEGTVVYWKLVNPGDCSPVQGGQSDYLYVTFYG